MQIQDSVALVTGANRGLGRQFAQQLLDRGAAKVYAAVRRPESMELAGVKVMPLDITDSAQATATARMATDVDLLVNNAGVATFQPLITGDLDEIRREMDTHFYGTLNMVRAFAPVLGANGGGAILNMLSVLSWFSFEGSGAYGAAKAAEWGLTDAVRLELAAQGTQVAGLHMGALDTEMMAGYDGPKIDPAAIAAHALDGIEAGRLEILADDASVQAKASLVQDPAERYGLTTAA